VSFEEHHTAESGSIFPHLRSLHLAYEERELITPLAQHGFYPGQVR
jgi:hypothetical protein